jgi:hypothetical protein
MADQRYGGLPAIPLANPPGGDVGGLVARYHGLQLRLDPIRGAVWFTYDTGPAPPPAPVSEPKITVHAPERRRSIEEIVREALKRR